MIFSWLFNLLSGADSEEPGVQFFGPGATTILHRIVENSGYTVEEAVNDAHAYDTARADIEAWLDSDYQSSASKLIYVPAGGGVVRGLLSYVDGEIFFEHRDFLPEGASQRFSVYK